MKIYLMRNSNESRHGVDYRHGLKKGQECGRIHEFNTRSCRPVFFTEDDVTQEGIDKGDFVELVYFHEKYSPEIRSVRNEDSSSN